MRRLLLLAPLLLACPSKDSGPICDAVRLGEALASAEAGDVVRVGACRLEGAFVVPAGVTLSGDGATSILVGETVVELGVDATLHAVRIESRELGVVARGAGRRTIDFVRIDVARGAGIALTGAELVATDVQVRGPVNDPNDPSFVRVAGFVVETPCPDDGICECTPGERRGDDELCDAEGAWARFTGVYGLYARDATLTLSDFRVGGAEAGFASAGVVLEGCTTTWNGGLVMGHLGLGVLVRGGSAELTEVSIERTREGLRGLASYALVATDAELRAQAMRLSDNDRYGVLAQGGVGVMRDFFSDASGDVALWIANSESFVVEGESSISRAGFAGVVASAAEGVLLDGLQVSDTRSVTRTLGSLFGAQTLGDGIHLSATSDATLRGVVLAGHARAGLVVDLAGGAPRFEDVSVDALAEGFGAIGGARSAGELEGDALGSWDDGIVRSELARTRDTAALGERFDAIGVDVPPTTNESVGIVFPMF